MNLIIVESPTKSKTIQKFLDSKKYVVESCNGHIRDLPKSKMGIDIEQNFQPEYIIPIKKRRLVNNLKKIAAQADSIYYATDADREGEAIAWHLAQILNLGEIKNQKSKIKNQNLYRITFHEITKEAIKQAIKNPRDLDINLVNAQQARRILDRLVGYELSPLLWKKVVKGLSAGRVQSPSVRLIVEREKEIEKFKSEEYWSIEAELQSQIDTKCHPERAKRVEGSHNIDYDEILRASSARPQDDKEGVEFVAKLIKKNDKTLPKLAIKTKEQSDEIVKDLEKSEYQVLDINKKQISKSPPAPFATSTLQQQANKELRFSVKQTMFLAQQLYEGIPLENKQAVGLITYHRTDSLNLAEEFLNEAKEFITNKYGEKYSNVKRYKTKSKMAQEAHEAIRPTSCLKEPEKIKKYLDNNQYKLYNLIWRRAIASQMSPALINFTNADIESTPILAKQNSNKYILRANGSNTHFDGWLKLFAEKQTENYLPPLSINEKIDLIKINANQHFTEPPPRYTEASLVKTLEKYGIGRPSTYAPIISTIQERNYVQKQQGSFRPTEIGILVNNLLSEHFPNIVDYQFTAQIEDDLDKIANGQSDYLKMIKNFYQPFKENLEKKEKEIIKSFKDEKTAEKCPKCGQILVIKMGRFGKFLACSGFPQCRYTRTLEQKQTNSGLGLKCPECREGEIIKKRTKKNRFFYGCSRWPHCNFATWKKPETP